MYSRIVAPQAKFDPDIFHDTRHLCGVRIGSCYQMRATFTCECTGGAQVCVCMYIGANIRACSCAPR